MASLKLISIFLFSTCPVNLKFFKLTSVWMTSRMKWLPLSALTVSKKQPQGLITLFSYDIWGNSFMDRLSNLAKLIQLVITELISSQNSIQYLCCKQNWATSTMLFFYSLTFDFQHLFKTNIDFSKHQHFISKPLFTGEPDWENIGHSCGWLCGNTGKTHILQMVK